MAEAGRGCGCFLPVAQTQPAFPSVPRLVQSLPRGHCLACPTHSFTAPLCPPHRLPRAPQPPAQGSWACPSDSTSSPRKAGKGHSLRAQGPGLPAVLQMARQLCALWKPM